MVFLRKTFLTLFVVISLLTLSFFTLHGVFNVPNVSAVTSASGLGVYWDAAGTKPVSSISWGNVSVGSEKDVTVYVKNLGTTPVILSMNMSALGPSAAYLKIYLCWDYYGWQLGSGSIVKVTLRLFVSPYVSGINNFSFNINIGVGLGKSPDINDDGIVNVRDAAFLSKAWLSIAGRANYDYRCDFNNDGIINTKDVTPISLNWLGPG